MIVILCGVSATGKDTYLKLLQERNKDFIRPVSLTTRPIRINEKNGIDYHFVDNEYFNNLFTKGELVNAREYNVFQNGKQTVWKYAVPKDFYSNKGKYIMILDPQGAVEIKKTFKDVVIVYLQCSYEVAKERATLRGDDMQEFERRIKDDLIQFNIVKNEIDLVLNTNLKDMFKDNVDLIETYLEARLKYEYSNGNFK